MKSVLLWLLINVSDGGVVHVVSYHETQLACEQTREQISTIRTARLNTPAVTRCIRSNISVEDKNKSKRP